MVVPRRPSRPGTRSRRPVRAPRGGRSGNTGLILGVGVGGACLLIIILAIALSGGEGGPRGTRSPSGSGVDVSALEKAGFAKCREGLTLIQQCDSLMRKQNLSAGEHSTLKSKLTRGVGLIQEGTTSLDKANQLTNFEAKYDLKQYQQARYLARKKLLEMK